MATSEQLKILCVKLNISGIGAEVRNKSASILAEDETRGVYSGRAKRSSRCRWLQV